MSITHVVFFGFKPTVSQEQIEDVSVINVYSNTSIRLRMPDHYRPSKGSKIWSKSASTQPLPNRTSSLSKLVETILQKAMRYCFNSPPSTCHD